MQNTYQDLITAVQNKNPAISPKLEGGKKFQMKTDFKPAGDQPDAIKQIDQHLFLHPTKHQQLNFMEK